MHNGNNKRNNIENIVHLCLFRQLLISKLIIFFSFNRRINGSVLSKNINCTSWPVNPPGVGVPTIHATYQIVLPIIYLYSFKGKCKCGRVGLG